MREIIPTWRQMGTILLASIFLCTFFIFRMVFADHGHENGTYEEYVAGMNVIETDAGSMYFKLYMPGEDEEGGKEDHGTGWHSHDHGQEVKGNILLIHGVPTSSWMWRDVAEGLSAEGYRVLVPDMIGFGASDKPTDADTLYSPESQAMRIGDLINILGFHDFVLVAHDYGGVIASELVGLVPERISHVIFQNALVQEFDAPALPERGLKKRVVMWTYGCKIMNPLVIGGILRKGGAGDMEKEERNGYTQPFVNRNQIALTQFFTGFDNIFKDMPEYHRNLVEFDGHVSSIWGTQDPFLDVVIHQEKLSELRPEGTAIQHNDIGHYMAISHPKLLVEDIISLINK